MVFVVYFQSFFRWFSTQTKGSKGFFFSTRFFFFSKKKNFFLLFFTKKGFFFTWVLMFFHWGLGSFCLKGFWSFDWKEFCFLQRGYVFFHVLWCFFFKVRFFKGFFCPSFFFFKRGLFFSQGSVFSKVFFFQWGPFFLFCSPGLGFIFFLKRFCFFLIEEVWIFAKNFFQKRKSCFFQKIGVFFVKGLFSQRGQGFSFLKGCFFFFFQMVLFLLFLQNTRTFFFLEMVEFFFFKKFVFCKVFEREKLFFF